MIIHNQGTDIEVLPDDSSELVSGIMQSSALTLHFRHPEALTLHRGATVEFEGNTYTLLYPEQVKKIFLGYFAYDVTFHGTAEQLKLHLVKDPSEIARTSFVFSGTPREFATLIVRSMGNGWTVGECLTTSYDKTIAFKQDSCWSAVARIAQEFATEWVVEGKTLSIRKDERGKEDPIKMSYGKGNGFRSGVSRRGNRDKLALSRLYVLGGNRNINPDKYGDTLLRLPRSWQREAGKEEWRRPLRTDAAGRYIEVVGAEGAEGSVELTDIYPHRVGSVSSVLVVDAEKHFYDIVDQSIPETLDYNDYRLHGEKAVLKFQTGALAGREFDIRQSDNALSGYIHKERRFELVPREYDGFVMPSADWAPAPGDKYVLFGIALPNEYVTIAEGELLAEALRTLDEQLAPQYTFEGEVDPIWAKKHWLEIGGKIVPGGHILFSDPEFHPTGERIRITSVTQPVNNPTAPAVTLSTAPIAGSFLTRVDQSEADQVLNRKEHTELQRNQRQSYLHALEHIAMVERAVGDMGEFSQRIKPSVIETMSILLGSRYAQFDFVSGIESSSRVAFLVNFDPATKRLNTYEAVLRRQNPKYKTLSNRNDPKAFFYWSLPSYTSPALNNEKVSYFIYAKVEKNGKEGNILLSPTPLKNVKKYWFFLIGTLSSVIDGTRSYNRLHGYTMISPGQIVVDTIASANGKMTIDLANGDIVASSVSFRNPSDGSPVQVIDAITQGDRNTLEVANENISSLSGWTQNKLLDLSKKLDNAKTIIQALQTLTDELKKGKLDIKDKPDIQWLLDAFNNGNTTIAGGLLLTRIIALSNQMDRITACLSGYDGTHGEGKILRAGIRHNRTEKGKISMGTFLATVGYPTEAFTLDNADKEFLTYRQFLQWAAKYPEAFVRLEPYLNGDKAESISFDRGHIKPNTVVTMYQFVDLGDEAVSIHHNGTGHFGDIYFGGNRIDYKTSEKDKPYLTIGSMEGVPIDTFLRQARTNDTPISKDAITLNDATPSFTASFTAPADGTAVSIAIDYLKAEVYRNGLPDLTASHLVLTLDGEQIASWQGKTERHYDPDPGFDPRPHTQAAPSISYTYTPLEEFYLFFSRYVTKGNHTLKLSIEGNGGGTVSVEGLSLSRFYDAALTQSYLMRTGLRLFGSADRYFDVDYRASNTYLARAKGGMKLDRLTLEEPIDAPGCVLAGGDVNESGSVYRSFGKYKNKMYENMPRTNFNVNTHYYTIYHSIGNTNYIPIVTNRSPAWADVPRVMSTNSYSFTIAFFNQENKVSEWRQPFTYVCYKAD